jgi:hypothetical protein
MKCSATSLECTKDFGRRTLDVGQKRDINDRGQTPPRYEGQRPPSHFLQFRNQAHSGRPRSGCAVRAGTPNRTSSNIPAADGVVAESMPGPSALAMMISLWRFNQYWHRHCFFYFLLFWGVEPSHRVEQSKYGGGMPRGERPQCSFLPVLFRFPLRPGCMVWYVDVGLIEKAERMSHFGHH